MNRRISVLSAFVLLSACATASTVPPETVLQKSTVANQALTSARFNVVADFTDLAGAASENDGTIRVNGVMQNGGRQLHLSFDADVDSEKTVGGSADIRAMGEVIVAGENEVYTNIERLDIEPADPLFSSDMFRQLIGHWWKMPSGSGANNLPIESISPDPAFLKMQTDVIAVTRDRGIVRMDGRSVHHYDTAIDTQKLASFLQKVPNAGLPLPLLDASITGELWIDAETYVVRRAVWKAHPVEGSSSTQRITLTLDVTDPDAGVTVTPPANALPVPDNMIEYPSLPTITPLE